MDEKQVAELVAKTVAAALKENEDKQSAIKAAEDKKKAEEAEIQTRVDAAVKAAVEDLKKNAPGLKTGGMVAPALNKTGLGDDAFKALNWWMKTGDASGIRTGEAYEDYQKLRGMKTEYDLLASTQYQGQEAVPTEVAKLIIEKRDQGSIVRLAGAQVIQAGSNAMTIPIEKNSPAVVAPATIDGSTDFTKPTVQPTDKVSATLYLFPYREPVDMNLVEDSVFDIASWLGRRAGRAQAKTENYYFTVGTGSSMPQGLCYASAKGDDMASASAWAFADVTNLYASIASQYRDKLSWFCTGASEGEIRALTGNPPYFAGNGGSAGANGQWGGGFIDPRSVVYNAPDMDALSTSKKPLVLANVEAAYAILERKTLTIVRDMSLISYGMIQFVVFWRNSGYIVNSDAVKHLLSPSA